MKKVLLFVGLLAIVTACENVQVYGPDESEKAICQENADTVLAHLKGWSVINQFFGTDLYYRYTDNGGKEHKFYCYELFTSVTDGKDTISILTEQYYAEKAWTATVLNPATSLDSVETIKRGNLAIKRLCGNDAYFTISEYKNVLEATFTKPKPRTEYTRDDYGLN